ncbi:MAG: hypothetical protein ACJ73W_00715, partial [Rubrobacteraceae bacterium]
PEEDVPGVVEVEGGSPVRLISDSASVTAEALSARNVRILRSGALDLEEILSHLVRQSKEGRFAASSIESRHEGRPGRGG